MVHKLERDNSTSSMLRRRLSRRLSIASIRRGSVASVTSLKNFFGRRTSISKNVRRTSKSQLIELPIGSVRDTVLSMVNENPEQFDARDVTRLRSSEWFVKRFIVDRMDIDGQTDFDIDDVIEQSSKAIESTMKWRKNSKINDLKSSDFPKFLFDSGLLTMADDANGNPVFYLRASVYKKIAELSDTVLAYGNYLIEQLDRAVGERPSVTMVVDMSNVGMSNMDMHLCQHFLNVFLNYYPGITGLMWVYEASWYVKPACYVLLKIVPEKLSKLVTFVDKKGAIEQIGRDRLPEHMGGTNKEILMTPDAAIRFEEFRTKLNLSESTVKKIKSVYKVID